MAQPTLRSIWQAGGVVINGWLNLSSSFSAEIMAHAGWDSLTLDLQHGLIDAQDAVPMLQAIATTATIPIARVPWNEPGIIMRMLDAGCEGIICPMVNTRADVEQFVQACRYPPLGIRSYGPSRASLRAGAGYAATANETVVTIAMIETAAALGNLEEIVQVPGLDAVYIGPSDLGQNLGLRPQIDSHEPKLLDAIRTIRETAQRHGVAVCMHTGSVAYAQEMLPQGFQMVTVSSDTRMLSAAASAIIGAIKG